MERDKQHLWIERKHPRVEVGIRCVVGLPNSDLSVGHVHDMSAGGLKFTCGRRTINNILPENMRTPGLVTGVVVEISLDLLLPDLTTRPFKCNAELIHFERLAEDDYHVGVHFIEIGKSASKALAGFLESSLKKQDS